MAITANCSAVTCPVFDISMHSQTVSERTNERTKDTPCHPFLHSNSNSNSN